MKSSANSARTPVTGAVIVCAGRGERSGLAYNKVLHTIGSKTALEYCIDAMLAAQIDHITVVASQADMYAIREITRSYGDIDITVTLGGKTRAESVYNGLKARPCDIAVIHDGARPFVTSDIITNSILSAKQYGSGIAAVPSIDTVKRTDENGCLHSLDRNELMNMQTPQTFRYDEIKRAYETVSGEFTDDAEVYEKAGYSPRPVPGSYDNIKITTAADIMHIGANGCKIGVGYDVHRLVEGRPLILGGVRIDYEKGLLGHSDADVLIHAVMDALLSAADLPDIGVLFPDTDPNYEGIASVALLKQVLTAVNNAGYAIGNISAVIMAQKPKLAAHIPDIRRNLAEILGISLQKINVSATTTERLGVIGSGDAIASSASCILTENRTNGRE